MSEVLSFVFWWVVITSVISIGFAKMMALGGDNDPRCSSDVDAESQLDHV